MIIEFLSNLQENKYLYIPVLAFSVIIGISIPLINQYSNLFVFLGVLLTLLFTLLVFVNYDFAFIVYFVLIFGFYDILGKFPIISSPFKIYLGDGILIFLVVLIINFIIFRKQSFYFSPSTIILIINFAVGVILFIVSVSFGNNINDIFGAFRRYFLYPLSAFVSMFFLLHKKDNLSKLVKPTKLIFISILLIVGIRLISGRSWWDSYYQSVGDWRAMGYFTGIIIVIGFTFAYTKALVKPTIKSIIVSFIFLCCLIISNWRLLWVFALMLPFVISLFLIRNPLIRIKSTAAIIGLIFSLALIISLVFLISPDWITPTIQRFTEKVLNFSFTSDVRYWAWKSAIESIKLSPIVGYGIGRPYSFLAVNSLGELVTFNLGVHNILLDLLLQSGIIGTSIFVFFQGGVIHKTMTSIARYGFMERMIVGGIFIGYLGVLVAAMVQSTFAVPTDAVAFYLLTGLLLGALQIFNDKYIQGRINTNVHF